MQYRHSSQKKAANQEQTYCKIKKHEREMIKILIINIVSFRKYTYAIVHSF